MVVLLFLSSELTFVCMWAESVHKFPGSKANILSTACCGLSGLFRTDMVSPQGNTAAMAIGSEQTHMCISTVSVSAAWWVEVKRTAHTIAGATADDRFFASILPWLWQFNNADKRSFQNNALCVNLDVRRTKLVAPKLLQFPHRNFCSQQFGRTMLQKNMVARQQPCERPVEDLTWSS
jgi:hypothetical protein